MDDEFHKTIDGAPYIHSPVGWASSPRHDSSFLQFCVCIGFCSVEVLLIPSSAWEERFLFIYYNLIWFEDKNLAMMQIG